MLSPVALREAHGLSMNRAAQQLGISRQGLANYEGGRAPPVTVAARMARLYGVADRLEELAAFWSTQETDDAR